MCGIVGHARSEASWSLGECRPEFRWDQQKQSVASLSVGRLCSGADVYLAAGKMLCLGLRSPLTVAQRLSSKGFYPAACALFVIWGPLIPGDVLGVFEA